MMRADDLGGEFYEGVCDLKSCRLRIEIIAFDD
jgi:hypothetical protein